MRSRLLVVFVIGGVLAAAGAWLWSTRPLPVPVARVVQDVPVEVFGLGTIEAQVLSRIGFEVGGTLIEVAVDHGDQVVAGAIMARLNPASQEARVARTEASVLSADAAAARAAAQRDRAEALLAQKTATARRRHDLAARGIASAEAAELAETELITAQADVALNRADAAVAFAAQAEARANRQAERTALDKHTLRAPFDGIVIARMREPGAALNPGEPVFTLVASGSHWAVAYVDEGRAGDLALGQKAMVTLRSRPGSPIGAEVVRIGLEADRVTEERRVFVRCSACPVAPIIGEQAEIIIETARLPRARLVPEAAVHGFDGVSGTVWTIENGRLAQRRIRFAARLIDARLAITDGLPQDVPVATVVGAGFVLGRAARVADPP
jgi:HlyD family secretion protein